ncbi:hypothetical protein PRNP1_011710 [Phytophthora ramorum]
MPLGLVDEIVAQCGLGEGADVVLEVSGAEPCIQMAVHVTHNGGSLTQGGMSKTDIESPIGVLCSKELHLTGRFRYSASDCQLALDMIVNGSSVSRS